MIRNSIFLILLLSIPIAMAFPSMSSEYHGIVIINGRYAAPGTIIGAYFIDGELCGETKIQLSGEYSSLSCTNGEPGEEVFFRVNYDKTMGTASFAPGNATKADLFVGDIQEAKLLLEETPGHGTCKLCVIYFALIGIGIILIVNGVYFGLRWLRR